MAFYTCTLNLAIDLFIETDELNPFVVNRTKDDDIQANGKGVNVSLILKMLGIDSTALGFQAGFTGNYIEEFLQEKQINADFVEVPGFTRINVFTQVNQTKEEYKLVNKGPTISKEAIQKLLDQISELQAGDYLCVSGSFPQGVPSSILVDIAKICYERKVHLIIDSSYLDVMDCLTYQPFLLKPNEEELALWFDKEVKTHEDYIFYGRKLLQQGAKNVLISLGSEGAILLNKEGVFWGNTPKGKVVNTACSGDTLLGTYLAGILNDKAIEDNLKLSLAAGSSTAFRKGLTDFSDVDDLQTQITIQKEE
ncbi:tagatose-6-phosphate kinase [Tetragenococcus halophilus subsp. flandriensis]|uniref:1-phosphofructokinase n=1 Tax=Tetragenococcus halophilus TaxID=51669 RepID=UPI0023E9E403|nr:1-phosphofructokinase [Tetragenococcus halophilus]GMA08756.1 tagatose-6-phosphate kinase [Tetragenococcus halophilus subsp. flandriensis]